MLEKANPEPQRYGRRIPTIGGEPIPGTHLEMILKPDTGETAFAIWNGSSVKYEPQFPLGGNRFLIPYSATNNLIAHRVVLLPSQADDYGSEEELIEQIQAFIHRYVDISSTFERISTYYVLFTWIYDSFNELPYLRLRGDPGTGKTRYLLVVGSICYRPIFASGASTVSPLFRLLDAFRGTLIIDEGDFRFSDEKAELVKILNNGNARGFPVLRSEAIGNRKEFNPTAFDVFGPKLVATRGYFEDRALESRFITEEMNQGPLRPDIPINLQSAVQEEALRIRNKLLMFRFRNIGERIPDERLIDPSIEPRMNQIFIPLLSVVKNETARWEIQRLARDRNREMREDRSFDAEAEILDIIRELAASPDRPQLSIKEIASVYARHHAQDSDRPLSAKQIGFLVRRRLRLATQKSHGVFIIPQSESSKLDSLYRRYGLADDDGQGGI